MLTQRLSNGKSAHSEQIQRMVIALFVAGYEATASIISWALFLLAEHPEVKNRLAIELDNSWQGKPLTASTVVNLTYTEQVAKETIRLYPPVFLMLREAKENALLGDFMIKKGALLALS